MSDDVQEKPSLPPAASQLLAEHGFNLDDFDDSATDEQRASQSAAAEALLADNGIQLAPIEHESLKYHLLGPSLTKPGQDGVDQKKVSEIIYDASKGSKFFNNEEVKDRNLTVKIDRILARKRQLEKIDLASDRRRADDYISELELSRDLSQHIIHVDCDAFYAAVEELDRPDLKDVPFAVGKGVLTTCNYHARKFGCRSGMAGFVAMKLCPQLTFLPLNFDKYIKKAEEVRTIIAEYDPNFQSASLDEAYMNITAYCQQHERGPEEVVAQLRSEVEQKCKITISAGIAANARLAKICSNYNKPNGQFRIAPDRVTIMSFMRDLSTRKVNGIGRVFERELDAIGVKTCGDIHEHRASLTKLFGEKMFQFLVAVYLGLGKTDIRPADSYERKSIGTESTFRDMGGREDLRAKLRHTAEELEKDMARTQFKGRTLVLKVKLHTYEVFTRQVAPPKAVCRADELYGYALPMLAKLEREFPGMKLRLMGLRCTHLVSTKKGSLDFFGAAGTGKMFSEKVASAQLDDDGWEVWPDGGECEDGDEYNDEFGTNDEPPPSTQRPAHGRIILPNPIPASAQQERASEEPAEEAHFPCPICHCPQPADDRLLNAHIDFCLSKQTIKEVVKDASASGAEDARPRGTGSMTFHAASGRKRSRPESRSSDGISYGQKKLSFAP
ncbi:hypothetical protein FH972_021050 [Carpinus fangiana]|uniref:DNA polymerase kappa n=1 Tax=Carpinus fangiana TaxID=176857 RepID=A0A5N6KNA2_9ROSI|nr:hypothetical protein FH972_021050 [Carpinus fangiana]